MQTLRRGAKSGSIESMTDGRLLQTTWWMIKYTTSTRSAHQAVSVHHARRLKHQPFIAPSVSVWSSDNYRPLYNFETLRYICGSGTVYMYFIHCSATTSRFIPVQCTTNTIRKPLCCACEEICEVKHYELYCVYWTFGGMYYLQSVLNKRF